ncbi:MAG: hypothetical protein U0441_15145 [Polyangiaceae bacterium]
MRRALASLAIAATAILGASCKYDPVPQEIIDSLGPETGSPSAQHRPGQPCLVCHSAYGGASPPMAFGGTVYTTDADGNIGPAAGVEISVLDWSGVPRKACSNLAGNFFLKKSDWKDPAFPLTVKAGSSKMTSLIGRDGSCGTCHKPADPDGPAVHDPVTGANFDSAGKILVDVSDTGQCQGAQ